MRYPRAGGRRVAAVLLAALVAGGPGGVVAVRAEEAPPPERRARAKAPSLAPVLIRWPLAARPRAEGGQPAARPAVPPAAADAEPLPTAALPTAPPEGPRPAPGTPRPGPAPAPGRPEDRPPGDTEPQGPLPGPDRPALPPLEPPLTAPPRLADEDVPGGEDDAPRPEGDAPADSVVDLALAPDVAPPRVGAGLGVPGLNPPTPEVRRWTFVSDAELSYEADEAFREPGTEWIVLRGQVDVRIGAERIQADEVRLNEATRELHAEGNVVLDHLGSRLAGRVMAYDLDTNTGVIQDAMGFTGDSLNFTGERVEKVADDKFVVHHGTFTSCGQPLPVWQVKASKAVVHVDRFVYVWNPRVYFKNVPALYLPWAAFPIRQQRTTGFMVPKISSSSLRGLSFEEEFFWAINRSVDLTIGGQFWDRFGYKVELGGRWHLNDMTQPGRFDAIFVDTRADGEIIEGQAVEGQRYDIQFEHRQTLWDAWDFTLRGEIGSDQLVGREFEPWTLEAQQPIFNQRLSLQRRWGKHSLNVYLENDERESDTSVSVANPCAGCDPAEADSLRQSQNLPLVEYRASGMQLGGRRWASLSMEGSLGRLGGGQETKVGLFDPGLDVVHEGTGVLFDHEYWRADLHPQFSFPMNLPFLEVVPELNLRGTWWEKSEGMTGSQTVDVGVSGSTFSVNTTETSDDDVFLWGWDAALRFQGPDFQRIYRRGALPGQRKWQHLIEPRVEFVHEPSIDEEPVIRGDQRFGFYNGRFGETQQRIIVGLVNTIRNKRVVPVGEAEESARDVVIWTVSTEYNMKRTQTSRTIGGRDETTRWRDIRSDLNLRPTENMHFSLRQTYDVIQDDLTQTSLVGGADGDWGYVDLSFSSSRDTRSLSATRDELSVTGEHWFYKNDRIRLGYDFTHSFQPPGAGESRWIYKRLVFSYFNQCCGVTLSWEDNANRSVRRERELMLVVSLKDLGNYIRYRRRSRADGQ